jgi:hypothetical protein
MIVVDTTVWADWFNGAQTAEVDRRDEALTAQDAGLTPLILTEVLQGFGGTPMSSGPALGSRAFPPSS